MFGFYQKISNLPIFVKPINDMVIINGGSVFVSWAPTNGLFNITQRFTNEFLVVTFLLQVRLPVVN